MENNFITKKEEKLRKSWFRVSFFNWIVLPLAFGFFISLLFISLNRIDLFSVYLPSILGLTTIGAVIFLLLYLCAYRDYASKLLNFFIFTGVFGSIFGLISTFSKPSNLTVFIVTLFFHVFHIWWLILSSKLVEVNKKIRERIKLGKFSDEELEHENNS